VTRLLALEALSTSTAFGLELLLNSTVSELKADPRLAPNCSSELFLPKPRPCGSPLAYPKEITQSLTEM
jgi:hypothetical protein